MPALLEIQNIGKRYRVPCPDKADAKHSLKKTIHNALTKKRKNKQIREFWALKELSFSLRRGETVAIMGHNGSGKSTVLKIISRIIEPTEGKIILNGRLGALLEVGTGMHPELTGRENIYFCGALLGMKRAEVKKAIDEIVEFAEIAAFLDAPFKQYSSGMALRLAASVLFHLKTDLLILDEILSVGDKAFQNTCFNKIGALAKEGKIILCVTHHEEWINAYCQRGILLESGRMIDDGPAKKVLEHYHTLGKNG